MRFQDCAKDTAVVADTAAAVHDEETCKKQMDPENDLNAGALSATKTDAVLLYLPGCAQHKTNFSREWSILSHNVVYK